VVNFDSTPQTVTVSLDGVSGSVAVAAPFHTDQSETLPVRLTIPPHELAVVIKQ